MLLKLFGPSVADGNVLAFVVDEDTVLVINAGRPPEDDEGCAVVGRELPLREFMFMMWA